MLMRFGNAVRLCAFVGLVTAAAVSPTALGQVRVFMALDGQQADAPTTGNTSIQVLPGSTTRIMAWMEDTNAAAGGQQLNAYQLIWPWFPDGGSSGGFVYLDNNPGGGGGDSIFVDAVRPDWVFSDQVIALAPAYNETRPGGMSDPIFGVFYSTITGLFTVPAERGILYMVELDLVASEDACGTFELRFNRPPKNPPLSSLFNPFGGAYTVDEWQNLTIEVECGDDCGNGIVDPGEDCDGGPCCAEDCTFEPEGTPCLDPSQTDCDNPDSCNAVGVCLDNREPEGTPCGDPTEDDCNNPDTCDDAGMCQDNLEPDGTACDDGEACTADDACAGGMCEGAAVDCSGVGDDCNTASCDPAGAEGNCDTLTPVPDGTACDDGAACTADDACTGGMCEGAAVDCSGAGDDCNTASCDPAGAEGNCDVFTPEPDGTICDDGAACTVNDVCMGGMCTGFTVDCSGAGDDCNTASCDPTGGPGNCDIITPVEDGSGCDDGNACTVGDVCTGGACDGDAVDCSGAGDDCNTASCDAAGAEGNCDTLTPVADGTMCDGGAGMCVSGNCIAVECQENIECDDGVDCTIDLCEMNACVNTPDDAACEDGLPCTDDACTASGCENTNTCPMETPLCTADGCVACLIDADCDDADPCTDDSCNAAGICENAGVDCSGVGDQCNTASCDPQGADGNCDILTPVGDGQSCDDGEACTVDDACTDGSCAGAEVDCSTAGDDCNAAACDPEGADGNCDIVSPLEDGISCNGGAGVCMSGICVGVECQENADCNDGVDCTIDTCEMNACVNAPDDAACDDGLPCTADTCTASGCQSDNTCPPEAPICTADGCVQCQGDPDCDDVDPCTIDTCSVDGICESQMVDCSGQGDDCNTASCDPAGPDGNCEILTPLADGTPCDGEAGTCQGGACVPVGDCTDPCDDGDPCTVNDTCQGDVCVGEPVSCSAEGDACNVASCDPAGGEGNCDILTPLEDGSACDDGAACTVGDVCTDGTCGGFDVDCSAEGDDCNTASCDPQGSEGNCDILMPVADGTPCDDGDGACKSGVCVVEGDCTRTLIIKGGACPAPYNTNAQGVLPMVLTGDVDFDVNDIDLESLELSRCDGIGEAVSPNNGPPGPRIQIDDAHRPFEGVFECGENEICSCPDDISGDGIDDLKMTFSRPRLTEALRLDDILDRDTVVVELRGVTHGGASFCARDCLLVLNPGRRNP